MNVFFVVSAISLAASLYASLRNMRPGLMGEKGDTGAQGPRGFQGIQGDVGSQGPLGLQGAQGPIGLTGAMGAKGDKGDTGATGATGATGPQGQQGPQGPPGSSASISASSLPGALGSSVQVQYPRYFREPVNPRRFRVPVGPIDSIDSIKLIEPASLMDPVAPEIPVSELTQWKGSPVSRVISPPQPPEECSKCHKNVVRYTKIEGSTICSGCK